MYRGVRLFCRRSGSRWQKATKQNKTPPVMNWPLTRTFVTPDATSNNIYLGQSGELHQVESSARTKTGWGRKKTRAHTVRTSTILHLRRGHFSTFPTSFIFPVRECLMSPCIGNVEKIEIVLCLTKAFRPCRNLGKVQPYDAGENSLWKRRAGYYEYVRFDISKRVASFQITSLLIVESNARS